MRLILGLYARFSDEYNSTIRKWEGDVPRIMTVDCSLISQWVFYKIDLQIPKLWRRLSGVKTQYKFIRHQVPLFFFLPLFPKFIQWTYCTISTIFTSHYWSLRGSLLVLVSIQMSSQNGTLPWIALLRNLFPMWTIIIITVKSLWGHFLAQISAYKRRPGQIPKAWSCPPRRGLPLHIGQTPYKDVMKNNARQQETNASVVLPVRFFLSMANK